ncbi:MAG: Crp/Fnr family transcriptional regulator [Paramuribaculum sp.]|nr:Crp/Fnr family transcriptional regulator [Paramuribaculum sp.]
MPNIVNFIRQAWPVGNESLNLLAAHMLPKKFPRRHKLVSEGHMEHMVWFLEKGMTRSYWLVDGEEITTSFSIAGCVVFSMDEVYYSRPSMEFVESIEPMEAYGVSIKSLMTLIADNIELCNWWRVIHQNEYRRLHQSHKERLTLDAAERYKEFFRQFPEVCRRARLTDIASYLGIAPATLSRIRRHKI